MRKVLILLLISIFLIGCQTKGIVKEEQKEAEEMGTEKVKLPLQEEIKEIIIEPGLYKVFTVDSLLKSMKKFKPTTRTYATKQPFQRGKFILKNGDVIDWISNSQNSILLIYKNKEQLFIIPNSQ